jgi:hypothetical protein
MPQLSRRQLPKLSGGREHRSGHDTDLLLNGLLNYRNRIATVSFEPTTTAVRYGKDDAQISSLSLF